MALLPHLAEVTVSGGPDGLPFAATLTMDGGNCTCTITLNDVVQVGLAQVALSTEILQVSPRHLGLAPVAQRGVQEGTYTVSAVFADTTAHEAAEILKQLFGANLQVAYRFHVDGGEATPATLIATLGPEPNRVTFTLPEGDERSKRALWMRFDQRITGEFDNWSGTICSPNEVIVELRDVAPENMDEALLTLARLFSLD